MATAKKKLTAKQRHKLTVRARRRKRAAQANDPAQLTQPLTPKLLDKELKSATALKYGGSQRQLDSERRISDRAQVNTTAWYGDYLKQLDEANKRTAGIYAGTQAQLQAQTAKSTATDATQRAALGAEEQKSAQLRGATVDPSLERTSQQAASARRGSADAFSGLVGAQGATQGAYGAQRRRIGGLEQLVARQDEAGRRRLIEQSGRELQSDIGNFRVQYTTEARERERKNQLERAAFGLEEQEAALKAQEQKTKSKAERDRINLAKQKLKLDKTKFQTDHAQKLWERRHKDRQYKLDVSKFGSADADRRARRRLKKIDQDLAERKHASTKGQRKRNQTAREGDAIGDIINARDDIQTLRRRAHKKGLVGTRARQYIQSHPTYKAYGPLKRRAAFELAVNHKLSSRTVRELKAAGIRVPASWK